MCRQGSTGLRTDGKQRKGRSQPNRRETLAPQNPTSTIHSSYSSAREKLLEHVFVGELLGALWRRGEHRAEVLRPEVDSGGYDLVVVANGIVRHIQLKASHLGAKTDEVSVSTALAVKPSGCVVWIRFDADTMRTRPVLVVRWRSRHPFARFGDEHWPPYQRRQHRPERQEAVQTHSEARAICAPTHHRRLDPPPVW